MHADVSRALSHAVLHAAGVCERHAGADARAGWRRRRSGQIQSAVRRGLLVKHHLHGVRSARAARGAVDAVAARVARRGAPAARAAGQLQQLGVADVAVARVVDDAARAVAQVAAARRSALLHSRPRRSLA